ncbi:MAG: hypothetical protein MJ238_04550, partial [Bacilli bacterium]|nr:hypothetical protein [Bacilli bacterium]
MKEELTPSQKYRKFFVGVLPMLLIFIIAAIIAFSLGLLATEALLFSVPLLLIPMLFALQFATADVENGTGFTNKGLRGAIKRYFVGPFNGCYNVFNSFWAALGLSLLGSLLISIIYVAVGTYVSSDLSSAIMNISTLIESGVSYDDAINSLAESTAFVNMLLITQMSESLIFTLVFTHKILSSAPFALIQGMMGGPDRRGIRLIYNASRKANRKEYNKNFFKFAWPLYPLGIFGYVAGTALTFVILVKVGLVYLDDPVLVFNGLMYSTPMGALGTVIAVSFYLPYYFYSAEEFAFNFIQVIRDTSVRLARENLEELKRMKEISEEQAKMY